MPKATTSVSGKAQISTNAAALTGTDPSLAITPDNLTSVLAAPPAIGGIGLSAHSALSVNALSVVATGDALINTNPSNPGNSIVTLTAGSTVVKFEGFRNLRGSFINNSVEAVQSFNGGNVLMPNKSAFRVYANANLTNQTGDGTVYSILFQAADYNVQSNYDLVGGVYDIPAELTFTCLYSFTGIICFTGITGSHTSGYINIGGDNAFVWRGNPHLLADASGNLSIPFNYAAPNVAPAEISIDVAISGGTKVVSISGEVACCFSGALVE